MTRVVHAETGEGEAVLPIPGRDHIEGSADAPFQLVEYGDYECPYCGAAYSVIKAVQRTLGDQLCFAFRNFPLKGAHPHAEHAAEAAEAAAARGMFWEMHDRLYENQSALKDEDLAFHAEALGMDGSSVLADVQDGVYRDRVREDFRSGARNGVNGTPTLFINGIRHDGEQTYSAILAAMTAKRLSGRR